MSSTVEQIKSRLNIVDVVQSYLKLQKAGANYKACCPFHSEKTPSFFVSPARESWHCFGCSKGGDMFSFVMEIEGIEFLEALKILAGRAGVELEKTDPKEKNERSGLLRLMEDAKKFYEAQLRKNEAVIAYLKKRGVKGETAKLFGIGFAPDGWRNLHDFLRDKGYSTQEMEKSGMIVRSSKQLSSAGPGHYDRFRSRIMFPLFNGSGQMVGFSGRIFGEEKTDSGGKYINTPQTVLYDKSKLLYAFDKAKSEIRKKDNCVLVEGQMDAVMSHQAGLANAVAVSGTALTKEHLNQIKRLTRNLVISFDKDQAGLGAAERAVAMALAEGFAVKIAVVPSGKDPADAVLENPSEWVKTVESAAGIMDFLLSVYKDREDIEKKVLPFLAEIPSEMEKAHWVKKIAEQLAIAEEPVWQELKKIKIAAAPSSRSRSADDPEHSGAENGFRESREKSKTRAEFLLDRLVGLVFWKKDSDDGELKRLCAEIIAENNGYIDNLAKSDINKLALEAEIFFGGSSDLENEINKIRREFRREKIKEELEETTRKIRKLEVGKTGELSGEPASPADRQEKELEKYLNDFHNLTKKLNELK